MKNKKTLTRRVFYNNIKYILLPLRNGSPVFVFSTTVLPAGRSQAPALALLQSNNSLVSSSF